MKYLIALFLVLGVAAYVGCQNASRSSAPRSDENARQTGTAAPVDPAADEGASKVPTVTGATINTTNPVNNSSATPNPDRNLTGAGNVSNESGAGLSDQEVTQAITWAHAALGGQVEIPEGTKPLVELTNQQYVVTFPTPKEPNIRRADYYAKVILKREDGKPVRVLVGQ